MNQEIFIITIKQFLNGDLYRSPKDFALENLLSICAEDEDHLYELRGTYEIVRPLREAIQRFVATIENLYWTREYHPKRIPLEVPTNSMREAYSWFSQAQKRIRENNQVFGSISEIPYNIILN